MVFYTLYLRGMLLVNLKVIDKNKRVPVLFKTGILYLLFILIIHQPL
jgi:hypothetical protein